MKTALISLAASVMMCAAPAFAQEGGALLSVRTGDQYTIHVREMASMVAAGEDTAMTTEIVYALDIVNADPTDRRWLYRPISMDFSRLEDIAPDLENVEIPWPLINDGASALTRIATDIGFECKVDAVGRCIEWSNWPVWSARIENLALAVDAFARMASQMSPPAEPAPTPRPVPRTKPGRGGAEQGMAPVPDAAFDWEAARLPVLRGFASLLDGIDGRSAAMSMAAFHPAAAVQGRVMTRGAPEAFTESWIMPYGAPPVLVSGTLVLNRIDRRANTATLTRRATLDADSARTALRVIANHIVTEVIAPVTAATGGTDMPDAQGLRNMIEEVMPNLVLSMEETTIGVVDLTTGMARTTTTDYVFTLGGFDQMGIEGATEEPVTMRARYELRYEPGAPPMPRLPRAVGN